MADRFYCPDPPEQGRLILMGDEARHLARVRRVVVGEDVEVFDGRGFASNAKVLEIGRDRVILSLLGEPLSDRSAAFRLTLATALPKGERFDWLIEKATELGVARLIPLVTERSVVDPRPAKLERLRRVIIEASKQCGRNRLMELGQPTSWNDLLSESTATTRLIAHPGGLTAPDWPRPRLGGEAVLAIGPEGGWTDLEIQAARQTGWVAISLGATLLRIETAGLVGGSILLALGGDPAE